MFSGRRIFSSQSFAGIPADAFFPDGSFHWDRGLATNRPGLVRWPGYTVWLHGLEIDSKGNLYLGGIMGKQVQRFDRVAP
jgi:sugar lactone lactonase YvrE